MHVEPSQLNLMVILCSQISASTVDARSTGHLDYILHMGTPLQLNFRCNTICEQGYRFELAREILAIWHLKKKNPTT